ncbi:MAG: hypothetical protein ACEQSK_11420, partial [Sphingomonadaceae bacterium]
GLWHGAAWTYVLWGGLHGIYLILQHGWRAWRGDATPAWWGRGLTFLAVLLAWVVFRAPDLSTAFDIWGALAGQNGVALPHGLTAMQSWLAMLGWHPTFSGIRWIELGGTGLPVLLLAASIAWAMPNTQEIFAHYSPAIERIFQQSPSWLRWRPSPAWGLGLSALLLCCLFSMNQVSEFLYFQF